MSDSVNSEKHERCPRCGSTDPKVKKRECVLYARTEPFHVIEPAAQLEATKVLIVDDGNPMKAAIAAKLATPAPASAPQQQSCVHCGNQQYHWLHNAARPDSHGFDAKPEAAQAAQPEPTSRIYSSRSILDRCDATTKHGQCVYESQHGGKHSGNAPAPASAPQLAYGEVLCGCGYPITKHEDKWLHTTVKANHAGKPASAPQQDDMPEVCDHCGAIRGQPGVKCWGDHLAAPEGHRTWTEVKVDLDSQAPIMPTQCPECSAIQARTAALLESNRKLNQEAADLRKDCISLKAEVERLEAALKQVIEVRGERDKVLCVAEFALAARKEGV